jgi:hypothetical protein
MTNDEYQSASENAKTKGFERYRPGILAFLSGKHRYSFVIRDSDFISP